MKRRINLFFLLFISSLYSMDSVDESVRKKPKTDSPALVKLNVLSPDRYKKLVIASPCRRVRYAKDGYVAGISPEKAKVLTQIATASFYAIHPDDPRRNDAANDLLTMQCQTFLPEVGPITPKSPEFHEKLELLYKSNNQALKKIKSVIDICPSAENAQSLSNVVHISHIKEGHILPSDEVELENLIQGHLACGTLPIYNSINGVCFVGDKSMFPITFNKARLVDILTDGHMSSLQISEHKLATLNGGKILCKWNGSEMYIELIILNDPCLGQRIMTAYPIFNFSEWYEGADICLGRIMPLYTDGTAVPEAVDLRLGSQQIVDLIKEALSLFNVKILRDNPICYELEASYIVDLAPVLAYRYYAKLDNFWDVSPKSVLNKGFYILIPKNVFDE